MKKSQTCVICRNPAPQYKVFDGVEDLKRYNGIFEDLEDRITVTSSTEDMRIAMEFGDQENELIIDRQRALVLNALDEHETSGSEVCKRVLKAVGLIIVLIGFRMLIYMLVYRKH
jgi:hypothetical protein